MKGSQARRVPYHHDRSQEELSAVVVAAHELKSPLVLIRQLALIAADETRTQAERQQLLAQLSLVADRGLRLTTDLTRTARLEGSPLDLEPVNALQLCDSIVKQMTPLYEQHGRRITLSAQRSRPLVLAHRDLLASVVTNFADNALHYGDDDSAVAIVLHTDQQARTLRIGVRDKGPAMPLVEWQKSRELQSATWVSRPQASGLGLYIAEQFSRAMGGRVGLTRHRNGATFYIDLPLSEQLSLL